MASILPLLSSTFLFYFFFLLSSFFLPSPLSCSGFFRAFLSTKILFSNSSPGILIVKMWEFLRTFKEFFGFIFGYEIHAIINCVTYLEDVVVLGLKEEKKTIQSNQKWSTEIWFGIKIREKGRNVLKKRENEKKVKRTGEKREWERNKQRRN